MGKRFITKKKRIADVLTMRFLNMRGEIERISLLSVIIIYYNYDETMYKL